MRCLYYTIDNKYEKLDKKDTSKYNKDKGKTTMADGDKAWGEGIISFLESLYTFKVSVTPTIHLTDSDGNKAMKTGHPSNFQARSVHVNNGQVTIQSGLRNPTTIVMDAGIIHEQKSYLWRLLHGEFI